MMKRNRPPLRALLLPPRAGGVVELVSDIGAVIPGDRARISVFSFGPQDDQVIDGWHAYHSDNAEHANRNARELALVAGWRGDALFRGPVLFLGHRDDQEEADVPMAILDAANLLGFMAAASE
jgi:hypothetical protein